MRRVLIHIPVGLANAFVAFVSGWLGLIFGVAFVAYELNEDIYYKRDKAYVDLKGFLIGIVAGAVVWGIVKLIGW